MNKMSCEDKGRDTYIVLIFNQLRNLCVAPVDFKTGSEASWRVFLPCGKDTLFFVEVACILLHVGRLDVGMDFFNTNIADIREVHVVRLSIDVAIVNEVESLMAVDLLWSANNELMLANLEHQIDHEQTLVIVCSRVSCKDYMRFLILQRLLQDLLPILWYMILVEIACVLLEDCRLLIGESFALVFAV